MHLSPALNRSSVIRRFEGSDAIEIRDRITFDFYTGLPHMVIITVTLLTACMYGVALKNVGHVCYKPDIVPYDVDPDHKTF